MWQYWKKPFEILPPLLQNEKGLKMFYDTLFHQKKIHCIKEFLIISTKITLNRFSKYSIEYWKQNCNTMGPKPFNKEFRIALHFNNTKNSSTTSEWIWPHCVQHDFVYFISTIFTTPQDIPIYAHFSRNSINNLEWPL